MLVKILGGGEGLPTSIAEHRNRHGYCFLATSASLELDERTGVSRLCAVRSFVSLKEVQFVKTTSIISFVGLLTSVKAFHDSM